MLLADRLQELYVRFPFLQGLDYSACKTILANVESRLMFDHVKNIEAWGGKQDLHVDPVWVRRILLCLWLSGEESLLSHSTLFHCICVCMLCVCVHAYVSQDPDRITFDQFKAWVESGDEHATFLLGLFQNVEFAH
jgi:hypothetical protein